MQHHDDDKRSGEEPVAGVGDAHEGAVAQGPDLRRRRLVRGAAAGVVPAILTLRSGGLAAGVVSACPGQIAGTATLKKSSGNSNGRIENFDGSTLNPVVGDECFQTVFYDQCPEPYVGGASRPANMGWVKQYGNNLKCANPTNPATFYSPATDDEAIVILNASSMVSLTPFGG